nr:MAG TPA: hypothetical protein [Caudoviricetes sp.]
MYGSVILTAAPWKAFAIKLLSRAVIPLCNSLYYNEINRAAEGSRTTSRKP